MTNESGINIDTQQEMVLGHRIDADRVTRYLLDGRLVIAVNEEEETERPFILEPYDQKLTVNDAALIAAIVCRWFTVEFSIRSTEESDKLAEAAKILHKRAKMTGLPF